jgi:DNA-binding transcriptional ArsR family regulator
MNGQAMNEKREKANRVEVSSDQLRSELIEIKERLSAVEMIESISNRKVVEEFVRAHLTTDKARPIMKECDEPRTREYLISKFGFKSGPALDHHLRPLREAGLLQQRFSDDGPLSFQWSNLFKGLPKSTIRAILDGQ